MFGKPSLQVARRISGPIRILSAALGLSGCISTYQLNENTIDLAGDVSSIQRKQVIQNLDTFIGNPTAIPSHVVLTGGGVTITNSVQPGITLPGFNFAQHTKSLSLQAQNQWVKNWSISPVNDPDDVRRLRALYRAVVYRNGTQFQRTSDVVDFKNEYPQFLYLSPDTTSTQTDASRVKTTTTGRTTALTREKCAGYTDPTAGCPSFPTFFPGLFESCSSPSRRPRRFRMTLGSTGWTQMEIISQLAPQRLANDWTRVCWKT
jgi:hypothetical protein